MTATIKHAKTNNITDWTQAQLDAQIALGNFAAGTKLADISLPSDWNASHTITGSANTLLGFDSGGASQEKTLTSTGASIVITNVGANINLESVSGGSGTVTSVSVATANGFAGTVANATSTPAITMQTSITGVLKGNGTAISAAVSGTDYAPGTAGNTTGIVKSTTTTGALTTAIAADFPTLNQNTTGSAATLTTPRAINGVNFDGSAAITVTAAAGTLSGATLASGVTASSLTSVGTIGTGVWQGTKVGLAYGGTNADLSATGGTSQVLKQVSSGAAVTVAQLAASDLSNGTTGSNSVVLATSPTLVTPLLGTPTSGVLTNCTGTASGLTAGNVTTNANLTGAVTSSGNATTLVSALTCSIPGTNPTNQTLVADAKAAFGYTINSIRGGQTSSGSITLAVKINGTNVTGLSAVSLTSTPGDASASGANTVSVGDAVTWVFSSNSSANDVAFTMKITRT